MATYYVKTDGNDLLDGLSDGNAWATWQKGFSTVVAGDTLYIRGGTYYPTETVFSGYDCGAYRYAVDGTAGNLIQVFNYPGEIPIMDATNVDGALTSIGVYLHSCDYWHLKGLNITLCPGFGMELQSCTNMTIERCVFHHNIGSGFRVFENSDDVLILNCDSYENQNPASPGSPDGFEASDIPYRAGDLRVITFRGCRSWNNSDDGYDMFRMDGYLYFDKCWAWGNGYIAGGAPYGDGDGFKLGTTLTDMSAMYSRTITNCMAFENRLYGFSANQANTKFIVYNNTSALNLGGGFNFWWYDYANEYYNNISCMNVAEEWNGTYVNAILATNSYDHKLPLGPVASAADFVSVVSAGADGARQSDGSLPILTFLHLVVGSDLIGVGTNVGITYDGDSHPWSNPPSLGAFEYGATVMVILKAKICRFFTGI